MSDFKDFTRHREVSICVTGHIEPDSFNEILSELERDEEVSPKSRFDWVSYEQKREKELISYLETIEANDCQLMKEDEKIRELEQENYDLTNQIKLVKARIIVVNKKLAKIGVE